MHQREQHEGLRPPADKAVDICGNVVLTTTNDPSSEVKPIRQSPMTSRAADNASDAGGTQVALQSAVDAGDAGEPQLTSQSADDAREPQLTSQSVGDAGVSQVTPQVAGDAGAPQVASQAASDRESQVTLRSAGDAGESQTTSRLDGHAAGPQLPPEASCDSGGSASGEHSSATCSAAGLPAPTADGPAEAGGTAQDGSRVAGSVTAPPAGDGPTETATNHRAPAAAAATAPDGPLDAALAACTVDDDQIVYSNYESELQMPEIMQLIQKDLSEPYSIYTYRYFINNWPNLCFLARYRGRIVGAIVCKLDSHDSHTKRAVTSRGYIAMLAVDQRFRKRRIGSCLVLNAIRAMAADAADEVVLETEVTNKGALRLYENLGFVRDKRLFRYYLNGVDALRLKLWLWPP